MRLRPASASANSHAAGLCRLAAVEALATTKLGPLRPWDMFILTQSAADDWTLASKEFTSSVAAAQEINEFNTFSPVFPLGIQSDARCCHLLMHEQQSLAQAIAATDKLVCVRIVKRKVNCAGRSGWGWRERVVTGDAPPRRPPGDFGIRSICAGASPFDFGRPFVAQFGPLFLQQHTLSTKPWLHLSTNQAYWAGGTRAACLVRSSTRSTRAPSGLRPSQHRPSGARTTFSFRRSTCSTTHAMQPPSDAEQARYRLHHRRTTTNWMLGIASRTARGALSRVAAEGGATLTGPRAAGARGADFCHGGGGCVCGADEPALRGAAQDDDGRMEGYVAGAQAGGWMGGRKVWKQQSRCAAASARRYRHVGRLHFDVCDGGQRCAHPQPRCGPRRTGRVQPGGLCVSAALPLVHARRTCDGARLPVHPAAAAAALDHRADAVSTARVRAAAGGVGRVWRGVAGALCGGGIDDGAVSVSRGAQSRAGTGTDAPAALFAIQHAGVGRRLVARTLQARHGVHGVHAAHGHGARGGTAGGMACALPRTRPQRRHRARRAARAHQRSRRGGWTGEGGQGGAHRDGAPERMVVWPCRAREGAGSSAVWARHAACRRSDRDGRGKAGGEGGRGVELRVPAWALRAARGVRLVWHGTNGEARRQARQEQTQRQVQRIRPTVSPAEPVHEELDEEDTDFAASDAETESIHSATSDTVGADEISHLISEHTSSETVTESEAFNQLLLAHLTRSAAPLTRSRYTALLPRGHDDALSAALADRRAPPSGAVARDDARRLCVVCCTEERNVICWPCRCLALCMDCREHLASQPPARTRGQPHTHLCPTCRTPVQAFSRLYIP
ncbi:hypothetical protein L1887_51844 [Cichorium endivia]|nr:hypothetical protein L1887_51844 [Cichorium endivia]